MSPHQSDHSGRGVAISRVIACPIGIYRICRARPSACPRWGQQAPGSWWNPDFRRVKSGIWAL